jgi:hypothetical protein
MRSISLRILLGSIQGTNPRDDSRDDLRKTFPQMIDPSRNVFGGDEVFSF